MCDYRSVGSVLTWTEFYHVRMITPNWNAMLRWPKQLSRVLFNHFDLVAASLPIARRWLNEILMWCKMVFSRLLPSLRQPSSLFHRSSRFPRQMFDPTDSWYRLFVCPGNLRLLVVAWQIPTLKIAHVIHRQSLIGVHRLLALDVEFRRNVSRGSSHRFPYIDPHF